MDVTSIFSSCLFSWCKDGETPLKMLKTHVNVCDTVKNVWRTFHWKAELKTITTFWLFLCVRIKIVQVCQWIAEWLITVCLSLVITIRQQTVIYQWCSIDFEIGAAKSSISWMIGTACCTLQNYSCGHGRTSRTPCYAPLYYSTLHC